MLRNSEHSESERILLVLLALFSMAPRIPKDCFDKLQAILVDHASEAKPSSWAVERRKTLFGPLAEEFPACWDALLDSKKLDSWHKHCKTKVNKASTVAAAKGAAAGGAGDHDRPSASQQASHR